MKYYFYEYKRLSTLKIKVKLSDGTAEISTGIKLDKNEWNSRSKKTKCENKNEIVKYFDNKLLETKVNLIKKNIHEPTKKEFKEEFGMVTGRESSLRDISKFRLFTDWIHHHKIKRKKIVSHGTWRRVNMLLYHLDKFDRNLLSKDINYKKWDEFQHYLISCEKDYSDNYIRKLSQEFKIYIEAGLLEGMPFSKFDFKFLTKKRSKAAIWLKNDEITRLRKVETKSHEEEKCLRLFLFQCFSGFGYSEAVNINDENITRDKQDNIFIKIIRRKTGKPLSTPISKIAYKHLRKKKDLNKITRQSVNRVIKRLSKRAGLDRLIEIIKYNNNRPIYDTKPLHEIVTSHVARKTFGRRFMEEHNNISVLSVLLGHKNEETTRTYIGWEDKELAEFVKDLW